MTVAQSSSMVKPSFKIGDFVFFANVLGFTWSVMLLMRQKFEYIF